MATAPPIRQQVTQRTKERRPSFIKVEKYGHWSGQLEIGMLCHFVYVAKTREELPYWDRFPLCVPYGPADGGFMGLNLHYVPIDTRSAILQFLQSQQKITNRGLRISTTWSQLKRAAESDAFKSCVKHYLTAQLRSRFLLVGQSHWGTVIKLPTAQWQKGIPPSLTSAVQAMTP